MTQSTVSLIVHSTSQEYYALAAGRRTGATARALPVEESDFDLVALESVLGQPV